MVVLRAAATELARPTQSGWSHVNGNGSSKRKTGLNLLARLTRTRLPPFATEDMAAPADDAEAMGAALWEAAKEGNTAQASRLLNEGAPVDWKNKLS